MHATRIAQFQFQFQVRTALPYTTLVTGTQVRSTSVYHVRLHREDSTVFDRIAGLVVKSHFPHPPILSSHFTPSHLAPSHLTPSHLTITSHPNHHISPHHISPHPISPHPVTPSHTKSITSHQSHHHNQHPRNF